MAQKGDRWWHIAGDFLFGGPSKEYAAERDAREKETGAAADELVDRKLEAAISSGTLKVSYCKEHRCKMQFDNGGCIQCQIDKVMSNESNPERGRGDTRTDFEIARGHGTRYSATEAYCAHCGHSRPDGSPCPKRPGVTH